MGLYFVGSTGGVLPIGPNGIPAFPVVSSFPDVDMMLDPFYDYTLELQGLSSNVTCKYDKESPVFWTSLDTEAMVYVYNATCPTSAQNIFPNPLFDFLISNKALGFWACQTAQSGGSYNLYFHGTESYATNIGNITCAISIQPAVFPVNWAGQLGTFTIANEHISTSPTTPTDLIRTAVIGLGTIVWQAQNAESNLLAELVINSGTQFFETQPYTPDEQYLVLVEVMIQGIIEYEVCLIYYLHNSCTYGFY